MSAWLTERLSEWLVPGLAVVVALAIGVAPLIYRDLRRAERLSARLRMMRHGGAPVPAEAAGGLPTPLRIVTRIGETIARSGALSLRTLEELRQTLHTAGFRGAHGLGLFVGTKLLLTIGLPSAVLTWSWLPGLEVPHRTAILAIAAIIGLLAPDKYVRNLRKRHLRDLDAGMPDALDMMVICGQAGLGMEACIERVGQEIAIAHPAVAEELSRTAHEMQVNADTRVALINLGQRTGLDSARRLGSILIQSMQYGTPLAQALRALSAEQRQETLSRFEAKASRLPVLLTLPMIVFILPCVFLIVAGPVMYDIYRALRG